MKAVINIVLVLLLGIGFVSKAPAAEQAGAEPSQSTSALSDAETHINALKKELLEAKDRVSELESDLSNAQRTIDQLNNQPAPQITASSANHTTTQTVDGQPVYDAHNPRKPVAQEDVIAEKFTAQFQSQPNAVTRLLKQDIERSGIRNITRIAEQVPNMQFGQSGNEARIAIRGMRTNRTGPEADQVVGIYQDGVSVSTTTQALGPYIDIKSIEVLRGPQGVMYGRDAFAGVINITSNEPDLSGWDYGLEGIIGYSDHTRFEGMINIPVLDSLAFRIAASSESHGGYIVNEVLDGDADDLHDRKQQYVRFMGKWQPSDNFSLLLNLSSLDQNQTSTGMWGYQQIGAFVNGQYEPGNQFAPAGSRTDDGPWKVARNMASQADLENLSYSLSLEWDIGFATLEWLGNKSKFESIQVYDSDFSDGGDPYNSDFNGWDSFRDTWSSDLRLKSNSTGRFDWLAGLYVWNLDSDWGWLETIDAEYFQPAWDSSGNYTSDTLEAFASAAYEVGGNLRLFGGLRWYDVKKKLRNGSKDSWNGVVWNAGIEYGFNADIASYLSVSTGYRPGGINEVPGVPLNYDSEAVTSYEIGLKSILADGSMVLNVAAFYNNYRDIQAQSFTILPLPGTAGLFDYLSTGGDMDSKGLEVEFQWLPGTRWNISANLAWLDAKFKDYQVPALAGLPTIEGHSMGDKLSLRGWHPAFSPEWSFGLQASYITNLGTGGTLTSMLQTTYASEYYANDLNLAGARQASQAITDVRLFWDLPGNHIRLQVYIENISDQTALKNVMIYNPEERPDIATFLADWGNPRTYGAILSYRY